MELFLGLFDDARVASGRDAWVGLDRQAKACPTGCGAASNLTTDLNDRPRSYDRQPVSHY